MWPLAIAGIVVQMFWLDAPRWLVAGLYVVIGWTAVAFLPVLWHQLGVVTFSLIVCGGVVYSLGARVYSTRRPDPVPAVFGFHEVFHALVVAAGLIFYVAIVSVYRDGLMLAALRARCARTSAGCDWSRTRPCRPRARATGLRARRAGACPLTNVTSTLATWSWPNSR